MLRSNLNTFRHKYFYSMIDKDDPQSIPDYFASNIENFIIRDRGELEMRDGLTARGTSPAASNLGCTVLYKSDGTKRILRCINGAGNASKFQDSIDGITWSDVSGGGSLTTDKRWALVQANDNIYGVNGTDTPIKYSGTAITTVGAIPQGTAIEWFKNFLWVFGNPTYKDRLYYSNASDPETFGGSAYININLGDASNGVGLRGTAGQSGRLYIGKQRSVWYLTGVSDEDFAISPLTYEHGVASHESMIAVKNDVWCVDLEGNVRGLYRTTEDNPFTALRSKDIQATIAGLNKSQLSGASAVYHDNYAMFFVPNGVNTYNSLCLVFDTLCNEGKGGWIKFTNWNIGCATVFNEGNTPKLYLFDSRTNNGQSYEWTGTSDNGQSIVAKYETKIYDFGSASQEKRFRYSYQFALPLGSYTSRFYASIDRFYYTLLASPSLAGTGNKLLGVDWTMGTDKLGSGGFVKVQIPFSNAGGQTQGTTAQMKLECDSSAVKMKLREFTTHFIPLGLR